MAQKPKSNTKPKTNTKTVKVAEQLGKSTETIFDVPEKEEKSTTTKVVQRETLEDVKVVEKPTNELAKRVASGEKIFFRWNGRSITSMANLKYNHCYCFDNLNDYSKVKVLSHFGKTRKVVVDKYQGRAGLLLEDGYTIRDTMTSREIDSLPRADNGSKVREFDNPYNLTGMNQTVKGQAPVAPYVVKKVVDVISEQEYQADNNNEFKISSASMHTRDEDRVD